MAVTLEDVDHVAKLARLGLSNDERAALRSDLESILGYVDLLREVEIPATATDATASASCPERDDRVAVSDTATPVLAVAPRVEAEGRFFRVPRVLD